MMRYTTHCRGFILLAAIVFLLTGSGRTWISEDSYLSWEDSYEDEMDETAICKMTENVVQMIPHYRTHKKSNKRVEHEIKVQVKELELSDINHISDQRSITFVIDEEKEANSILIQKYIHKQDGEKA